MLVTTSSYEDVIQIKERRITTLQMSGGNGPGTCRHARHVIATQRCFRVYKGAPGCRLAPALYLRRIVGRMRETRPREVGGVRLLAPYPLQGGLDTVQVGQLTQPRGQRGVRGGGVGGQRGGCHLVGSGNVCDGREGSPTEVLRDGTSGFGMEAAPDGRGGGGKAAARGRDGLHQRTRAGSVEAGGAGPCGGERRDGLSNVGWVATGGTYHVSKSLCGKRNAHHVSRRV